MKRRSYIVLIVIAAIVALPFIIALFIGKTYSVERTIVVNKPVTEVFDYAKHLKNQDDYGVWIKKDPNIKKTYTGNDAEVGFISSWESDLEDLGKGQQTILEIKDNEYIKFRMEFFEPFKSDDIVYLRTSDLGDGSTEVKWEYQGKMKYPMNLMLLFYDFDELMGQDFVDGLTNMKNFIEEEDELIEEVEEIDDIEIIEENIVVE